MEHMCQHADTPMLCQPSFPSRSSDSRVVVLADIAHSADGLHVLIGLVRADVVQGRGFGGVAVGPREIYANLSAHSRR